MKANLAEQSGEKRLAKGRLPSDESAVNDCQHPLVTPVPSTYR